MVSTGQPGQFGGMGDSVPFFLHRGQTMPGSWNKQHQTAKLDEANERSETQRRKRKQRRKKRGHRSLMQIALFEQPPFVLYYFAFGLILEHVFLFLNLIPYQFQTCSYMFIRIHTLYLDNSICKRLELNFRPNNLEPQKGLGWASGFFQKGQGDYYVRTFILDQGLGI